MKNLVKQKNHSVKKDHPIRMQGKIMEQEQRIRRLGSIGNKDHQSEDQDINIQGNTENHRAMEDRPILKDPHTQDHSKEVQDISILRSNALKCHVMEEPRTRKDHRHKRMLL